MPNQIWFKDVEYPSLESPENDFAGCVNTHRGEFQYSTRPIQPVMQNPIYRTCNDTKAIAYLSNSKILKNNNPSVHFNAFKFLKKACIYDLLPNLLMDSTTVKKSSN